MAGLFVKQEDRDLQIRMPRLSDTMEEGVVVRWLKQAGEVVSKGAALAEIETDKATIELEAPADGVLLEVLVSASEPAQPGAVIAVLRPANTGAPEGEDVQDHPAGVRAASATGEDESKSQLEARRLRATPLSRRLAAERGLDLSAVERGSGPNGRILRHDVELALAEGSSGSRADETRMITASHAAMARQLSLAKREIPHYYVDVSVDVTRLLALRQEAREQSDALDVSVTAYFLRAVALSLGQFPQVNASWNDGSILTRKRVDIGVAVAVADDELIVPVVRDADAKDVAELAAAYQALVTKAQSRRLREEEITSASFTISNLGMYGVDAFHAIINPPQSGILAIGAIRRLPVAVEEAILVRDIVQLSLSADHRVYSGALAAAFMKDIRERLERPLSLLL